jgi:hypothetical protein
MAGIRVQMIAPSGQDRSYNGRYYLRRLNEASCTYWVTFEDGVAIASPADVPVLVGLGVVRALG